MTPVKAGDHYSNLVSQEQKVWDRIQAEEPKPVDLVKRRHQNELLEDVRRLRSRESECVEQGYGEEVVSLIEAAVEKLETAARWFRS